MVKMNNTISKEIESLKEKNDLLLSLIREWVEATDEWNSKWRDNYDHLPSDRVMKAIKNLRLVAINGV